jgi:hypothetical protein
MTDKRAKTYNSGYSLVVTHLTTNPPVRCLNRAERTGSLVFNVLWSYVEVLQTKIEIIHDDARLWNILCRLLSLRGRGEHVVLLMLAPPV